MYQRKDGLWCDTISRPGQAPKFFYGKTKTEVKRKKKEWAGEKEKGIFFREAAEMWLVSQESKVRESTYRNYKAPMERCLDRFGNMRVTDIMPNMVQNFIDDIAAKGYSRSRVALHLVVMNGTLRAAITAEDSVLKYNPCSSVRVPSSCKNNMRDLPPKYAVDIIKKNVDKEFGLFPYLLVYSGLRRGEALALTDQDFTEDSIIINKALKSNGSNFKIGEPKTSAAYREVVLLKPLADALPPKWTGYLFSLDGGKSPLTESQFVHLWNAYCLEVGLAHIEVTTRRKRNRRREIVTCHAKKVVHDICCHQLRHEFATICFDAGLDPMDTAEMLGHSSDEITKRIYTHIKASRRKKTYGKLQDYVSTSY